MTKLERMARAMWEAREYTLPERTRVPFDDRLTNDIWVMARAALTELREPDGGMIEAMLGITGGSDIRPSDCEELWHDVIDHILSEERK